MKARLLVAPCPCLSLPGRATGDNGFSEIFLLALHSFSASYLDERRTIVRGVSGARWFCHSIWTLIHGQNITIDLIPGTKMLGAHEEVEWGRPCRFRALGMDLAIRDREKR